MLIRSRTNFLFIMLAGLASATAVLIFAVGFKLANLLLPQIIHMFNETIAFCQGQASILIAKFNKFPFYLTFISFMLIVFWIYVIRLVGKITYSLKNIQTAKINLPPSIKKILKQLGIHSSQVVLYESHKPSVFCAGPYKAKIYISSNLIKQLNANELTAILAHEAQHLRNYDPLRTFITSIFEKLFIFIPLIKQLSRKIRLSQETIADNFAVSFVGKKAYLKTIVKIDKINFTQPILESTGFENLLNQRVERLLGKASTSERKNLTHTIGISLAVLLALAFFALLPTPSNAKSANHTHKNTMCRFSYISDCCLT